MPRGRCLLVSSGYVQRALQPPVADSFRDIGRQEIPQERGAASAGPQDGESWRVLDGVPSVASPKKTIPENREGAANATLNLDEQDLGK